MNRRVGSFEDGPSSIVAALIHQEATSKFVRVNLRWYAPATNAGPAWPKTRLFTLTTEISRRYPEGIDSVPETRAESPLLLVTFALGDNLILPESPGPIAD